MGLISLSKRSKSELWCYEGLTIGKKANEQLRKHGRSQVHHEEWMKFRSFQHPSVAATLLDKLLSDQEHSREMLILAWQSLFVKRSQRG